MTSPDKPIIDTLMLIDDSEVDLSTEQQFAHDQPGFDRFAKADVVSNQEIYSR